MKKVLSLAVAVLVLSVGAAFAEPPVTAMAGNASGFDSRGLEQLSDADMVGVMGEAWWSGACTAGIRTGGAIVWFAGVLSGNQIQQVIGSFAPDVAAAACH